MYLRTENLTIGYAHTQVQTGLNLQVQAGNFICMLGRNGCGKSTLLRTIAGLQPPIAGRVSICHESEEIDLTVVSAAAKSRLLALVLTEHLSVDNTRVREVVAMGRYPYTDFLGALSDADNRIIDEAISEVGISQKADSYFNELSDGEKQRVMIAKSLAQQTPVILLDEPTSFLDLPNRIKTMLLLRRLAHEQQKIIITSTHEHELALQEADTLWLMQPGNGIIVGSPQRLIESKAFQTAFQDDSFSFESVDGDLKLRLKTDWHDN